MKPSQTTSIPVPCAAWAHRLAALHPDDLLPDEQVALQHHLADCSACAAVYAAYQQVDARILSLPTVWPSAQQVAQLEAVLTDQAAHDPRSKAAAPPQEWPPLPARAPTRLVRFGQRMSLLPAALLVLVLIGSAFALFSGRHAPSSGSSTGSLTAHDMLYTVSYSGTVYAVDPGTGRTVWSTSLDMKPDEQFLVSGGKIFLASSFTSSHSLYALQASDGHVLWQRSYQNLLPPGNQVSSLSRYLASDGETLYIGSATGIYAWRANDGQQLWYHAPPAACRANPSACLIDMETVSNGLVYVYFDGLYALNATNGTTRWSNLKVPNLDFTGYPLVVTHNHVYVPDYGGSLAVHVLQAENGAVLDTPGLPQDAPYDIITDGSTVYIRTGPASGDSADVYALRSSDDHLLWHQHYAKVVALDAVSAGSLYYTYLAAPPSASSQKRVVPLSSPTVNMRATVAFHVCAIHVKDGSLQWCQPLPTGFLPSAAASRGILYAPGFSSSGLDAIRLSDGRILWHILAGIPLDDADTVVN